MDKEYILAEIRRTATANGGAPLGRNRLSAETGIKPADWEKYWPRFSDAVREAGFEPNRLQSAFEDEIVLEKLVSLVRELGHFPVKTELRIKARQDQTFPNEKTFARVAAGLGQRLAAKVREYCAGDAGYDDVLRLLPEVSDILKPVTPDDAAKGNNFGFVYLMKSGRYYKIGRSNSVGRREYELAIQLPEPLRTLHRIETDDPVGIEKYWHERFASKRKNGEWFDLEAMDVTAFSRLRKKAE